MPWDGLPDSYGLQLHRTGQESGVQADAKEQELSVGRHAFLLCTDGFWEYVYEEEMARELSAAVSPQTGWNA